MCLASSKHINGGRLRINRVLKIYSVTCLKTGRPTIDSLTNFAIKVVKSCSVLSHNTTFCHCKTLCLYCASTVVRFRFRIDLINSTPQKTKTKQDKTRRNSCCTVICVPPLDASRCLLREGCTTIKCHLTRSRVYYLMENLYRYNNGSAKGRYISTAPPAARRASTRDCGGQGHLGPIS
jgi:hypothetical protein